MLSNIDPIFLTIPLAMLLALFLVICSLKKPPKYNVVVCFAPSVALYIGTVASTIDFISLPFNFFSVLFFSDSILYLNLLLGFLLAAPLSDLFSVYL